MKLSYRGLISYMPEASHEHPPHLAWQHHPESSNGRELPAQAASGRGARQGIAPGMATTKVLSDTEGGDRDMGKACWIWCYM